MRFAYRFVLNTSGDSERMARRLDEAELLCRNLADRLRQGWVDAFRSSLFRLLGRHADAVAAGERACAVAGALGDRGLDLMARYYLGQAYMPRGDFRRGRDLLKSAVVLLEEFGPPDAWEAGFLPFIEPAFRPLRAGLNVSIRLELTVCLTELGELREGLARATEAVRIADVIGRPYLRALAYYAAGRVHLARRDLAAAVDLLEQGVELCGTYDFRGFWAPTASALAWAYALCGRVADAVALREKALARATAMKSSIGYIWMGLGQAHLEAGRLDEAEEMAVRAIDLARDRGEHAIEARALRILTEIIARREPPDVPRAAACFVDALKLADELGMQPLVGAGHFVMGMLYHRVGRCADAETHLATATEMFRDMDAQPWLDHIATQLAQAERSAVIGSGG